VSRNFGARRLPGGIDASYHVGVPAWVIWIVAAAALAAGEIFTLGFFLGPIALAAVVAAAVAALGGSVEFQLAAFVVGSLASLALIRPIVRRHVRTPAALRTGTAALVGEPALVVERVDSNGGRVRIGGEVWSARAYDGAQALEPGARVTVLEIRGATALVSE
jgi:membrane protein implicated in regulation of membrane protease activity